VFLGIKSNCNLKFVWDYKLVNCFCNLLDPGRDKVVAPIVRFENVDDISELSTILVSLDEFPTLFTRYQISTFFSCQNFIAF
jgi:hypothetical protein